MVKLVADLATYEAAVAAGKTSPDVMYLILAEKKVFFQGEDWTQGGGGASGGVSEEVVLENEAVIAYALNNLNERHDTLEEEVHADYVRATLLSAEVERLTQIILENEEITAQALGDLNSRLKSLE